MRLLLSQVICLVFQAQPHSKPKLARPVCPRKVAWRFVPYSHLQILLHLFCTGRPHGYQIVPQPPVDLGITRLMVHPHCANQLPSAAVARFAAHSENAAWGDRTSAPARTEGHLATFARRCCRRSGTAFLRQYTIPGMWIVLPHRKLLPYLFSLQLHSGELIYAYSLNGPALKFSN
eukprot:EST46965.1 Hypothetical protein SS50377_fx096 [Spironucleus salmonicida]